MLVGSKRLMMVTHDGDDFGNEPLGIAILNVTNLHVCAAIM